MITHFLAAVLRVAPTLHTHIYAACPCVRRARTHCSSCLAAWSDFGRPRHLSAARQLRHPASAQRGPCHCVEGLEDTTETPTPLAYACTTAGHRGEDMTLDPYHTVVCTPPLFVLSLVAGSPLQVVYCAAAGTLSCDALYSALPEGEATQLLVASEPEGFRSLLETDPRRARSDTGNHGKAR